MKKTLNYSSISLSFALILILSFSCVPYKDTTYFNDIDNIEEPVANPREQKVIMPFDKLYIRVLSTDQQTANILNFAESSQNSSSPGMAGYMVDEKGNIAFPFAGEIKIAGLSLSQAGSVIQKVLSSIISNPVVIVKFIETQVTIMGEVNSQGVYPITQDKINIYEALALGGGLTRYGDRSKVILIRQEDNKPVHYRLDLSNSKVAGTKLFYVLPNDVIIVEPRKSISGTTQSNLYSTILTTITSLFTIFYITRYGL
ncbi:MAG: polysaccharide biosynthesis/export family protein [Bacteroidales bacterium]|jgi:polysaccharide export outer membrane protein|nr:polysaccharide biosynthesis/export family protein [Bacteroidales bacterium]